MLGDETFPKDSMSRLASGRASHTALLTAIVRARHYLHDAAPLVLSDPLAEQFLPTLLNWFLRYNPLAELAIDLRLGQLRAIEGEVLGRARVVEDALRARLAEGLAQCIILGAGYDTTVARFGAQTGCRFFEIDHPATQRQKQKFLGHLGRSRVDELSLHYVPIDFHAGDLRVALHGAGFNPAQPALVSWLGVVMYLPPAATLATLQTLRAILAPGSVVYLDVLPTPVTAGDERALMEEMARFTARRGEPVLGMLDCQAFLRDAAALGYEIGSLVDGVEIRRRYFAAQRTAIQPPKSMVVVELQI